ncbi:SRPBCC family protein [Aureliella helgolandensis]|uniref:Activator of Hsp90 ATPase homologue 1/2-like C-terminal domain-containing protein n=1 Tax=Aureliella helgolandensis TaxID=2527968 RepID=A0A518GCQ0_9BACT|nr:SRPBCC domain-containing protein [Aureliella helgolandensis]QDV26374.1 hypothetical protein Q31a_47480 [Aureliella helgolandensis]
MSETIHREMVFPKPPEAVWKSLASSAALSEWLYPNDFKPRVGHRFTFEVPPKPEVGFGGLSVQCEVLKCDEPNLLVFSWEGGALVGTQVSFKLEPEGDGTRLLFEHSGFNVAKPFGKQALRGARQGWSAMLSKLAEIVAVDKRQAR